MNTITPERRRPPFRTIALIVAGVLAVLLLGGFGTAVGLWLAASGG